MAESLHKFTASSLNEAYKRMRQRLGDRAVVVRTTEVRDAGWRGMLGGKVVEITASAPEKPVMRQPSAVEKRYAAVNALTQPKPQHVASPPPKTLLAALTETPAPIEQPEPRSSAPISNPVPGLVTTAAAAAPRAAESLRREIREVRQMLEMLVAEQPGIGLPRECFAYYRRMLASGLPRKTAATLLASIAKENDPGLLREEAVFNQCLRREIRRRVAVTGGIALNRGERHTVAMVGATGVGKTTNLAKLAARYALHEHARVALVTIDTYRVAAPDQLRVYANIMGIPLCVANDADEVRAIMKRLRDYDLVLIDTAGGSPFNREQIAELRTTLAAAEADEVIQVVSATTPHDDLPHVLNGFRTLRPTALMITKLDETRRHGAIYATMAEARLPLSFLGVGQNVPDDLILAQPDTVVDYLMESGDENG